MRKYNITYREEYKLLVCLQCQCALGVGFACHLKREHKVYVSEEDQARIKDICFSDQSPYFMSNQPLMAVLDFMQVYDGYKCSSCNYYCRTLKSAKVHAKASHDNVDAVPCKVQSLSNTCFKTWFGVTDLAASVHQCEPVDFDVTAVVKNTMGEVLHLKHQPPEPIKQRNVFYAVTGWYPEPESVDKFHSVDKLRLLHTPANEDDEKYVTRATIFNIFCDSLRAVNDHDYMLRRVVNGTGAKKPLTRLQNDATIDDYCTLYTRLVFFAWNLRKEQSRDVPLSETATKLIDQVFEEPNRRFIYQLILHFLTEKLPGTSNDCGAIIPVFIRFSCYKTGSLLRADEICRLCAKVAYLLKLSVLETVAESPPQDRIDVAQSLRSWVAIDDFNVYSFICRMQALARKVAQSDNRLPIITRLRDDDPLDVIIHGVSLTCDQLRMVYRQALSRCKTLLEDLLLGLTWSAENVYDNFGNRTVGFQIMADRNASNDVVVRSSLLKHILCSEELRRRFVLSIGNGNKVLYRSSEATNYLNVYDEYIENLLLVVHVGSGMPARATELETYRVKNGPSTSRNVFYLKPQVFFHCEYSKSRSIRAANKGVSRFMNEEASLVLLKDLLVVRPFVCSIATFLELNPDDIYSTDLFVRSGVKLEALSIRNAFARLFYNYCHTAISFGEYRHIAKYYCRQLHITDDDPNCSADNDGESDEDPDSSSNLWELVLNKQFGHSSVIANRWYAVRNGEHTRMRDHILQQFRTLSRTWHLFLTGKSSSTKRKLEEVSGTQDGPCVMAVRALKEGDNTQLHIPRIGTSSMQRCSSEQKQFVTIKQSSDTLDSLKLLYRDANVTFKSSEQRAAAENVLHTNSDILAILPTGCGKSLLFFLYSFKYSTLTNIVIVPTLSLQSDLKRRAECHRISCSISLSLVANEQLVILTPEAVISQEGSELIMRLYGADQLGKIFVDEVHLFSTDGEFRPMFRQLPTLRFMPVSFVLMTATAPEWVVSDILKCFFAPGRMPLVIRQQTNRLNISYETKMGAQVGDLTNQCAVNLSTYTEDERSIIYVPAIDLVTRVKEAFVLEGIPCSTYTGQQMLDENRDNFASWRDGETKIMIATSAFGLGVDYDQVRHVLFFGLPHSLEDFGQQSGRAGRDGKPSSALLMFDARKEHFKMDQLPDDQKKCFEVMMTFATTTSVCRRRLF